MLIDFRQRISVAGWVMALVMTLTLVWQLPEITWLSPRLAGNQIALTLSPNVIEGILALLTSLGVTDSIIQIHPRLRHLSWYWRVARHWPLYCLPAALALVVVVAQPLSFLAVVSVFAMIAAIAAYTLIQFLLYEALEPAHPHAGQFIFFLHGLAYVTAFMLFLLVYQARGRLLIAVPMAAGTSFLLAIELLRNTTSHQGRLLRYALTVALIISVAGLGLTFSPLTELTHGILLIWIFFLLVNFCQNHLQQRVRTSLVLEYGVFSILILVLIYLVESGMLQILGREG